MKIKNDFLKRNIAGECVVVPVGNTALTFNGLISLNEVGEFLWDHLLEEITFDQLIADVMEEYDVEEETARQDTLEFISRLKAASIIE